MASKIEQGRARPHESLLGDYSFLVEDGECLKNPVGQDGLRTLVRRVRKLPWIPNEDDWQAILTAAMQKPVRNRVMLTLAYDAGLRREELCSLCTDVRIPTMWMLCIHMPGIRTDDIDPSRRMIMVLAENSSATAEKLPMY